MAAFAVVYLVWGSTYAAVRVAVSSLPPLWMAAARFAVAAVVLYGFARWRGAPRPTRAEWRSGALVGALMVVGGGGAVCWAEQYVESGLAAVLRATVPMWVLLLSWRSRGRPRARELGGLGVGLVGVWLLVAPTVDVGGRPLVAVLVLLGSSLSWAAGTLLVLRLPTCRSAPMLAAQQMFTGSVLLGLVGLATGEAGRLGPQTLSPGPLAAALYLTVFGSIAAYGCYLWLLGKVGPMALSTHTFVNPVVAVLLGHLALREPLSWRGGLGVVLVVLAVAAFALHRRRGALPAPAARAREAARGPPAGPSAVEASPRTVEVPG